ncbi:phage baseplate assembly protein domain-containing protein [Rhodopila sp.]|uniref:phage baseplate assembly protein domain-containing protein n=1 Tax=Rhodopila sp. TaxID=2480087 RepID=UPI003D0BD999
MLNALGAALKSIVSRGKVANSRVGPRTLLQVTGLDGVTQQVVELLLPPGYSARPAAGADIALLQVLGSADHVVALGGDMAGQAIGTLAPGEFGLSNGSQMVIVRADHIEMISPTYVLCTTPQLRVTGAVIANYGSGNTTSLATHTHGSGGAGHTAAPDPNT